MFTLFSKIQLGIVFVFMVLAFNLYASECVNDYWQPTFVHDVDVPDGPYYVMPYGSTYKLQGYTQQEWTGQACQLTAQYGVRDMRGFTSCYEYTRVQCGCRRGLSEGNSVCRAFLAGRPIGSPNAGMQGSNTGVQSNTGTRFNNPSLVAGYWVDRCLAWASQCDAPAANAFCQRAGYARASDFRWSYHAPTMIISSGQVCNDPKSCGGFDYVTCDRSASGYTTQPQSQPQSGSQSGSSCSQASDCPSGICMLGICYDQ